MSKSNLQKTADDLFNQTKHNVLFGVKSKGEFFTSENSAQLACVKDEKPVKFVRGQVTEAAPEATKPAKVERLNAKDTIEAVKRTTTGEELDTLAEGEDRKSVLAEIALQREVLAASEKNAGETPQAEPTTDPETEK